MLTTAGAAPDRQHHEATFAHFCGVAPIPASRGQTRRFRLNRAGDRALVGSAFLRPAIWRRTSGSCGSERRTSAGRRRRCCPEWTRLTISTSTP
ncbi:transposase [Nonomuraea jabiensis]|uniref:transposase n=1 Tax=Nonomuraea jabiensis TaxID=882448 RepID=UPI003D706B53